MQVNGAPGPGLLAHPLTRHQSLDSPRTTELRRTIIQEKGFLRRIYESWYQSVLEALPPDPHPVVELGSGAGFLKRLLPGLVTSEVFPLSQVSVALQAQRLPFRDASLGALVLINVFHHIPDAAGFLREAGRCVRPQGAVVMLEPWLTPWSRVVYGKLHHEPCEPQRRGWDFPSNGPLSGANIALPWIVFRRDLSRFVAEYPEWDLRSIRVDMPFLYLLSGGVSARSLMPAWTWSWWRGLEGVVDRLWGEQGMHALIVLERTHQSGNGNRGRPRYGRPRYGRSRYGRSRSGRLPRLERAPTTHRPEREE